MKNETNKTWDSSYTFRCLKSDIPTEDGEEIVQVPKLKPGKSGKISIFYRIPVGLEKPTLLKTVWQFYHKTKPFGKVFEFSVLARPDRSLSENFSTSQATQTDNEEIINKFNESFDDENDQIPFPACFNMDVPFTNNATVEDGFPLNYDNNNHLSHRIFRKYLDIVNRHKIW